MGKKDENSPIERALKRAEAIGLSQTDLAERLGLLPQNVNNWRRRGMPAAQHAKVAKILGWTVEQLLGHPAASNPAEWPFPEIPLARIQKLTQGQKLRVQGVLLDELDTIDRPPEIPRRRRAAS